MRNGHVKKNQYELSYLSLRIIIIIIIIIIIVCPSFGI